MRLKVWFQPCWEFDVVQSHALIEYPQKGVVYREPETVEILRMELSMMLRNLR